MSDSEGVNVTLLNKKADYFFYVKINKINKLYCFIRLFIIFQGHVFLSFAALP